MYKPQNIYLFKVNNEKIDNVIDNRKEILKDQLRHVMG